MSRGIGALIVAFIVAFQVSRADAQPAAPAGAEDNVVYIFKLRNMRAEQLEPIANLIFNGTGQVGAPQAAPIQPPNAPQTLPGATGMLPTTGPGAIPADSLIGLIGKVQVVGDPATNTLLVTTPPSLWPRVTPILTFLDAPKPQVLIKAVLAWLSRDGAAAAIPFDTDGVASIDQPLAEAIQTLERQRRIEILSRPYVLSTVGEHSTISVSAGSTPIPPQAAPTTLPQSGPGFLMEMLPRLLPDGTIELQLDAQISELTDQNAGTVGQAATRTLKTRRANVRLKLADARTTVIRVPADQEAAAATHDLVIFLTARVASANAHDAAAADAP